MRRGRGTMILGRHDGDEYVVLDQDTPRPQVSNMRLISPDAK
jgi:hypothetical protein